MKKILFTLLSILTWYFSSGQTNTFPSSGNVGIGTLSPATSLDIKYGIDIEGTSTGFIAPYYIGYVNDVGSGGALQYILLSPLISTTAGNPSAGLSGILAMYRGSTWSFNINAEYRVIIQSAYGTNHIAVIPLTENSPLLPVYSLVFNGQLYAGLKITDLSMSSYRVTFRGHWWNNINSTKPQIVDASAVSSVNVYKNYESVLGGAIYAGTNGYVGIGGITNPYNVLTLPNSQYIAWKNAAGTGEAAGITVGTDDALHIYNNRMGIVVLSNGNVGVGVTAPQSLFSVNGTIAAKQVTVTQTGWPDFVFHPSYKLRPISSLAYYIQQNNHLPGIPSAREIESRGLNLGEMQKNQMQKIEELTSYLIEQNSVIGKQKVEIRELRTYQAKADKKINQLQVEVDLLSKEFEQLKNKK